MCISTAHTARGLRPSKQTSRSATCDKRAFSNASHLIVLLVAFPSTDRTPSRRVPSSVCRPHLRQLHFLLFLRCWCRSCCGRTWHCCNARELSFCFALEFCRFAARNFL